MNDKNNQIKPNRLVVDIASEEILNKMYAVNTVIKGDHKKGQLIKTTTTCII